MEYRQLGRSGVRVSEIGLGGNTFGRACDDAETARIVAQALDLGINHFDCADTYGGGGVSERYLGAALRERRHDAILATKTGFPLGDGPNNSGLSRARIIASCEASLKRLGTEYVDVFYLHRPDPLTDIDESLGALDDLVRQGKVRYPACSNYAGWEIARMAERASAQGRSVPIVSQSLYNLFSRDIARDITPAVLAYGLGIVPFSPLAGGLLTGKYAAGQPAPVGTRGATSPRFTRLLQPDVLGVVEDLTAFSTEREHTIGELALAWLLAQPGVVSVIAGVTTPEQVDANAQAAYWRLTTDELSEIDGLLERVPLGLDT